MTIATQSSAIFQKQLAQDDARARHGDIYDNLTNGLATGRFGGVPTTTNEALALVDVLRRRSWAVDYRRFADAVPHFAPQIRITEVRAVLQLLGMSTRVSNLRGRDLPFLPKGSFVADTSGEILFPSARSSLVDPLGVQRQRIRSRKSYTCYIINDLVDPSGAIDRKTHWIIGIFRRFASENRLIFLLTFLSNTLVALASLSVGFIFDKVLPTSALDTLVALMIGIGILFFIDLQLRRNKARVIAHVSGRIEYVVSATLFEKLTSFPISMLASAPMSDQVNRLKQFETIRDFYAGPFVAVVLELPFMLLLIGVIFVVDAFIGTILLSVVVLYTAIGLVIFPKMNAASRRLGGLKAECLRLQGETIAQRQQIVHRGLGDVWAARLAPKFSDLSAARENVDAMWRILNTLVTVATPVAVGAVIFVGATQVMTGALTGGALIACTILSTRVLGPIQQALVLAVRMPDILALFKQVDGMMKLDGGIRAVRPHAQVRWAGAAPPIVLDSLAIRYPRAVVPALKGISLKIEGGSFTCVTGASGAGKSTLLRAIVGHFQAPSGTIMLGASNIDQLSAHERADRIGYLGHRALQIHGTLAQNLRLTKPQATMTEMRAICDDLGLCDVIDALPDGFETRLDHDARRRFSPAFRTKFALAQLLLKDPKVLLLDEPESGFSDADEKRMVSVIKRRAGDMTCLMVTHRPSLARQADKVLVLQNGQIMSYGTPKQVSGSSG